MRRTVLPLLAVPLVLTACSAEEPVEVTDEDVTAIEQSMVNISTLNFEIVQAEVRIGSMCMQDEGFTVHDPIALFGNGMPGRFAGFQSPYARIPTVEQAEKLGFGAWVTWTDSDAALEMQEDPDYLATRVEDDGWWDPAFDVERAEFDALGDEYAATWEEAWQGSERFAYDQEFEAWIDAGEDPFEFEVQQPPFGGCELETIETVYGEPVSEEADGETYWSRPGADGSPMAAVSDGQVYSDILDEFADAERAFLDCLADRGYGEWEFDEYGYLPTGDYIAVNLYGDTTIAYDGDERVEVAELPDDTDVSDPVAAEFAIALDFAQCAEDGGLRDGAEEAYARRYTELVIGDQTELYAYEQQLEGYLANAQASLEGE
ncbi:hypothetical protein [Glycomyces dulcitolivorans]|uniref:hypothetical protein n=1 Tax=Glycomyces dulcitolivorans TaxID=2200759 RepID=UPI000DD4D882|nr:hypothetical protein [Glycomyces dulcitolivorans]